MCGIFGIVNFDDRPVDLAAVGRAVATLRHRGPDDEGYLLADTARQRLVHAAGDDTAADLDLPRLDSAPGGPYNLALGHRRLSILDLSSSGHQPMSTPDGRYTIVYNGEIYNFVELRDDLRAKGVRFRSRSDTEVLLAAWVHWGPAALNRLVGMFAFAMFDAHERRLILARDPFGIKPLYYVRSRDRFAFASEIKALLELPGVGRTVNPQRLYDYLRFGMTGHESDTLLASVRQLGAAHMLEVRLADPAAAEPRRYWHVDLARRVDLSFDEAAASLRDLFLKSVQLHLRSDVPVGAALSGGIDSSAIVTGVRRVQKDPVALHTFSYIAGDGAINEERWIDLVGRAVHATRHKVQPAPEELAADLDELIHIQDEPFGTTSIYAQFRVFRLAHQAGIKVVLDGQGADELLCGYRYYLGAWLTSLLRQSRWVTAMSAARRALSLPDLTTRALAGYTGAFLTPRWLQKPTARIIRENLAPHWMNGRWFADRGVETLSPWRSSEREALREQLYRTLTLTGLPKLLRYVDRNAMAFSIENRVPFLTTEVAELALALPEGYFIGPDMTGKSVFRRAMRGIVPDAVLDRRDKIGFSTPEQNWLTRLRPWVDQVLRSDAAKRIRALNLKAVVDEWQSTLDGRRPFDARIWRWINLVRWTQRFSVRIED